MIRSRRWSPVVVAMLLPLFSAPASAQAPLRAAPAAAAPVNGFPNWEERVLHQWMNRARVEPAVELAGCGANCSTEEMLPSCYTPIAPLMWDYELAVAARFHAESMARQAFFGHDTPCSLRSDLASIYPASCDASSGCSCAGSGATAASSRVGLFGASYSGEIIAAGYGDPVSAFYGWLYEPASSSSCNFSFANGHRWLILKATNSIGSGYATGGQWGRYYAGDFGFGGAVSPIPSGAHYPRQADTIEFWANWYDDEGPSQARVVVGSVSHPLSLARGTATSGAWTATVNGLGTGCHRYHFEFVDAGGATVRHPESGTFGIGDPSTCADWAGTAMPPPALAAAALSSASVEISWTSSSGASQYELQRSAGGVPFAPLITTGATGYVDYAVSPHETYLYRVRPVGGTTWSNIDHATTIAFTDDPLIANATFIRSVHLSELRTGVNAAREAGGLPPASWTDTSPHGLPVRAAHITELRSALAEALAVLGKSATFLHSVGPGAPPRAVDFQELRDALK